MGRAKKHIQIEDLPQESARTLTEDDLQKITGGLAFPKLSSEKLIKWASPSLQVYERRGDV